MDDLHEVGTLRTDDQSNLIALVRAWAEGMVPFPVCTQHCTKCGEFSPLDWTISGMFMDLHAGHPVTISLSHVLGSTQVIYVFDTQHTSPSIFTEGQREGTA